MGWRPDDGEAHREGRDLPPGTATHGHALPARLLEARHLLAIAQAIRNRYVHGGETASTKNFPAQEKVPVLRLLTGTAQLACLAFATSGAEELGRQLRRHVGMRR